ncbi:unnamed protein product [Didymodactylos carnosus]|uniref:Glutathione S-transferase 3, mitochondrial n=1 Tax=Didymodactylos carnosus TaxID=1234261 RepID=A0A813WIH4_9BILA|nr:unnamed protein product [Didymodactylos carnosus]CAF1034849.1 unnamed protein product [Didymodactylos carnosus]CAF3644163.1 unnamed protein product [Didymodactylos carnosus]CAF3803172.1 unnamed protein product [Didymodactylos carnosus]
MNTLSGPKLVSIILTKEHGYAAGVALSSWVALQYMGVRVMKARKRWNVNYPKLYADEQSDEHGREFNCVQRGHQNTLENYPQFLMLLGLGSIKYPLVSSIGGGIWIVGRLLYFHGYATGNPKNRQWGSFQYIGIFTMLGCAVKMIYDLVI